MAQPPSPLGLDVWVVYQRPRDLPQFAYVVRRHVSQPDGTVWVDPSAWGFPDLESARTALQERKLFRLDRHPDDDPVIVETWL